MAFKANLPPSIVAKMTREDGTADETDGRRSKEDFRKMKEMDEARKAGTIPAMKDEHGNDINPHIPQYIAQAPWYVGATTPTLRHQKVNDESKNNSTLNDWYEKGVKAGTSAKKYREGACENCGAMGHKKKECLEKPRTIGAKYTNVCAPDDFKQPILNLSYEAKRDRCNGYDPESYKDVIEEYRKVEEVKREIKAKKLEASLLSGEGNDDDETNVDEDKYAEDVAMPGQKFETKQRITVRNLRIREDIPKYLRNLDPNSAYYDPKSRSMRGNPFEGNGVDPKDLPYAGDNFVRYSGEAMDAIQSQLFAFEASSKGTDVNVQADPTKLELLHKEYMKKKEALEKFRKGGILEKYGGAEYLEAPPMEIMYGQNEEYVEYTRQGTQVKGKQKRVVRSKYEEDILEKNHTRVWGSYWEASHWGYKCCHSLVRGSYCIGEIGIKLDSKEISDEDSADRENIKTKKAEVNPEELMPVKSMIESNSLLHQHLEKLQADEKRNHKDEKKKKRKHHKDTSESSSSDDDDHDDDEPKRKKSKHASTKENKKSKKKQKKHKKKHRKNKDNSSESEDYEVKLKKAIDKEKQRVKDVDKLLKQDERQRPYDITYDNKGPSELEVEACQRVRMRPDDPMAKYFSK